MKLYARLEKKYSENDHVINEVIRYYTEQEVLNEYWSYWVDHTYSFLTKENCLTDWLNTYKGWINDELQAYEDAQDEILATQHKILDEILTKKKLEYNKIMKQEQYILINEYGNKFYYKDLEMTTRNRIDGPAIEWSNGSKEWFVDGKRHRLDGPAYEQANGDKEWWVDGKKHRLDGPACEYADGYKEWYVDGQCHRLDGPAVIYADGSKFWYVNDIRHRIDGPAIEYIDGEKSWYVDGKRHRLDGPAVEWPDGDKDWWVDGEYLTKQEFNALSAPTLELTLEDIAIKYGVDVSKVKIKK